MLHPVFLRSLTTAIVCLLLVLLLFEALPISIWYAALVTLLSVALVEIFAAEGRKRVRRPIWRQPLIESLGLWVGLSGLIVLSAWLSGDDAAARSYQFRQVFRHYFDEFAPILLFGILVWRGRSNLRRVDAPMTGFLKTADAMIWLWFLWCLLSAACSIHPETSFRILRKETTTYLMVFIIVQEISLNHKAWTAQVRTLAIAGLLVALVSGAFYFYYGAIIVDPLMLEAQESIRDNNYIYHNPPYNVDYPWRAQWPTLHPNRMASLCIVVAFAMLLGACTMGRGELRVIWPLLAIAPVYLIFLTQTRGAMLAVLGGLALLAYLLVYVTLFRAKIQAWIKLAVVVVALLGPPIGAAAIVMSLPKESRERVMQVVQKDFWSKPEAGGTLTTRERAWDAAQQMAADRPIFGVGHGWPNFEREYKLRKLEGLVDDSHEDKPHAHMNILEVLAENGYPAMTLWVTLNVLVALALGLIFFRSTLDIRQSIIIAMLLGGFAALTAFGMTNFTLRYQAGLLNWIMLAWIFALVRTQAFVITAPAEPDSDTGSQSTS